MIFGAHSRPFHAFLSHHNDTASDMYTPTITALSRSTTIRLVALGALSTSFLTAYYAYNYHPSFWTTSKQSTAIANPRPSRSSCPPKSWSKGSWNHTHKYPPSVVMTDMSDSLPFSGFEGCASDREFWWHLGAEHEEQWDRFPDAQSYEWVPPPDECDIRPYSRDGFVTDLVENGGWLLIGDSVTENHFFSLSCLLYPHVHATPNYTENPYFDRAWPQNLYLKPDSPLLPSLKLPAGFDIETTPLVTFRRVDLLLDRDELVGLYDTVYNPSPDFSLFSEEDFWSMSIKDITNLFLTPMPTGGYRTMVASTGGHWTTSLFSGLLDENKKGNGINNVLRFFTHAMEKWAEGTQEILTQSGAVNKDVVVRTYLPGHDNCHNIREVWSEIQPMPRELYNWNWIHDYNLIFEDILDSHAYPDIHFLDIDRPARLRPDAHVAGDCLHLMTGSGVLEGWSHYIWHFISRELGGSIR